MCVPGVSQEGQPGWAVPVLVPALHPQQLWDAEDAVPWHLLLQPGKPRARLLQCLPWRFSGCWAVLGQECGIGAALLVLGCPGVTQSHKSPVRSRGSCSCRAGWGGGLGRTPWFLGNVAGTTCSSHKTRIPVAGWCGAVGEAGQASWDAQLGHWTQVPAGPIVTQGW